MTFSTSGFLWISAHWAPEYFNGGIQLFSKIREDIREWMFTDEQLSPGSLFRVCELSMDGPFYGSSNDTIGGHVQLRRPEISPFWFEVVL